MDRFSYWAEFINRHGIKAAAEVGVWKGDFAEAILRAVRRWSAII